MAVNLSPIGNAQVEDSSGNPAYLWKWYTYVAGSSTPATTYTTSTGSIAQANPIVLNALGLAASPIWLTAGVSYKLVLTNAADVPQATFDNVSGINDTTTSADQWLSGPAPTYISATSFSLVGDQTSTFSVGRRVKTTNTGGTVYGTITASTFGAVTTVTVVNDSSSLDSGLSAVSYGLLSKSNDALPRGVFPTMANVSKAIYGLTYSNNGADATNDIDIAAGGCVDSTGVDVITVAALTKQSDAAWAVGTNAGGLDTGAVGNSDYYIWAIKRVDTGVTDILYSLSSTAPTMPANYTLKRLIGWFKRVGGTIVAFTTYETEGGGLELSWNVPTLDINLANTLTTSRRTDAVKVPLNFSTIALLTVAITDASAGFVVKICCPDEADAAPSSTAAPLANFGNTNAGVFTSNLIVRTSSAGLIAARSTLATIDAYAVVTNGFRWARRN